MRLARATALAVLALAACAHGPPVQQPSERPPSAPAAEPAQPEGEPEAESAPAVEEGFASFYAHRFHGRRTASGARYDMHALTCAHPTAPFGTRLRVTNLETGQSVIVIVNDRGPYARGRVVDVSLAAARRLGMVHRGVVRVRVERIEAPPRDPDDDVDRS